MLSPSSIDSGSFRHPAKHPEFCAPRGSSALRNRRTGSPDSIAVGYFRAILNSLRIQIIERLPQNRGHNHADHTNGRWCPAHVFRSSLVLSGYQRLARKLYDRPNAMGSLRRDRVRRWCRCYVSCSAYAPRFTTTVNAATLPSGRYARTPHVVPSPALNRTLRHASCSRRAAVAARRLT